MAPLSPQSEAILAHMVDGRHEGVAHWPAHNGKPNQLMFMGGQGEPFVATHPDGLAADLAVLHHAQLLLPESTLAFITENDFFAEEDKAREKIYALTPAGRAMVGYIRWGKSSETTPFWSPTRKEDKRQRA